MSCSSICSEETHVQALPTKSNLELYQGSDAQFECVLTDERGEPVDITNDTVTFTVWDYFGGTVQIEKINLSGSHLDPTNGTTVFTINHSDYPDSEDVLDWVYEIRRIQAAGTEAVHITGRFKALPSGA